jgi:MoaA/NifB/PqqE/SkfB family radical SAM enzyme
MRLPALITTLPEDRLRILPLVVLYITDGCNSRCVTCDIWKLPRRNMEMSLVRRLVTDFKALDVKQVVLSGGEAMQHPEWPRIAEMFRNVGIKVMLLTNGLALKKQVREIIDNIDGLTVSLDGATSETYRAIRGVDALPVILEGMQAVAAGGVPITTRTTLQRGNYQEMPLIVDVAKAAGAKKISFLAVDVSNMVAFGPRFDDKGRPASAIHAAPGPALTRADLPVFARILDQMEHTYAADFKSGLIAENPIKLWRLHRYFMAVNGLAEFEGPNCNAPHISTVIEVDGSLRPCFFLPKMGKVGDESQSLEKELNSPKAVELRKAYRTGERIECTRCVCPLHSNARALRNGIQ